MDTINARIAINEVLFRDVNQNIVKVTDDRYDDAHFVCECGDMGCEERIPLSLEDYSTIREDDRHFFVKPGHEMPRAEDVISRNERFVVVEKRPDATSLVEGSS